MGDLSRDVQSPEPELLYYGGAEDQEDREHQVEGNPEEKTALPWDVRGAQDWYKTCRDMPYYLQSTT